MVSVSSTPGTSGCPGKCPSKTGLASGTVERVSIRLASRSKATTLSIISKYSRRMRILSFPVERSEGKQSGAPRRVCPQGRLSAGDGTGFRSSGLRRHQGVDAGHQVLQDEILLGRNLALVDFLGPLLERQLDPEGFIDREGDVEERERI